MPSNGKRLEIPQVANGEDFRTVWMASQLDFSSLFSWLTRVHQTETDTQRLKKELQSWREKLPAKYHDIDQSYPQDLASDSRKLWLFCQYHEANLYIDARHQNDAATHIVTDHNHTSHSAKIVLEAASVLPPDVVNSHR